MKPLVLLDIDGVINPLTVDKPVHVWQRQSWIDAVSRDVFDNPWKVKAARPVLDFVRQLHKQSLAEVRWHTEWQTSAILFGAQFSLPAFKVQRPWFLDQLLYRGKGWKLQAVRNELSVDTKRPIVWIDDEAKTLLAEEQAKGISYPPRLLTVSPNPTLGLEASHIADVGTFLRRHRANGG